MFTQTARYYDKIYAFKDYRTEVESLVSLLGDRLPKERPTLLDVACGTGHHVEVLKEVFDVEGLDLDPVLLDMARQRCPGIPFHHGDMTDFWLGRTFDVVTCLFSSIGYVKTLDNLARAVTCMARHLRPGGLLAIEPWFAPADWRAGTVHALLVEEPELKIARVNTSFVEGRLSYFDLHYLIGTPAGTEHVVEHNELGLFERQEMEAAISQAGLHVSYDAQGLTGRGLFIGHRAQVPSTGV
jgi:dTDP-3-amino-3,4,6-trideoxy-alpha-D-glucopyranose N,N-dimethyltransferase